MIPMIEENVVSRGWLSGNELTSFIAISESTPGPFAINIATFIGSQVGGPLGAILATIGVILPSLIIIMILALIIAKFLSNRYVQGALNGIKPIILSLILSTAIVLAIRILFYSGGELYSSFNFDKISFTLLVTLIFIMYVYKKTLKKNINPIFLIIICAIAGLFIYY